MHKVIISFCFLLLVGCREKEEPNPIDVTDRQLVLSNVGLNVAIRSFLNLQSSANQLQESANSYIADSTSMQKLLVLQKQWLETTINWKHASLYNFGPIADENLLAKINSNADELGIETVLSKPIVVDLPFLNSLSVRQKGLSAIEYLVFGNRIGDNLSVIESFKSSKSSRTAYLRALCLDLKSNTDLLMYKWSEGGENYLDKFISSDGNDKHSSIALLSESILDYVSIIKNDRIGKPMGLTTGETANPRLVDGKYSDHSLELLNAEFQCLSNIFTGKKIGTTGINGINYLLDKAGARSDNQLLSQRIMKQFDSINKKIEAIQVPISQALVAQPTQIKELYTEVVTLETLLQKELQKGLHLQD